MGTNLNICPEIAQKRHNRKTPRRTRSMQRSGLIEGQSLNVPPPLHQSPHRLVIASFAGDVERCVACGQGSGERGIERVDGVLRGVLTGRSG